MDESALKKATKAQVNSKSESNVMVAVLKQQQNAFVDFIVIQEFPLASKKTTSSDEKNNRTNKKKGNNIRNSEQQQQKQQQHHEKEERLRTYQIDDEIAIPFRARFLPKKHKGKNFIRVCEGKFCAWSQ